jgi:hypothetical protein
MRSQHPLFFYSIVSVGVLWGAMFVMWSVQAQMTSTQYRIEADSINVGGRDDSTSTSYGLQDTLGELGTGYSTSTNYAVAAGYRQMLESYIALSTTGDVVMSPNLGGITGGTANGSLTATVTTDNRAGYVLSILASTSPAMRSAAGDTIGDYQTAGADPDFTFTIPSGSAVFGFSPEGADIVDRYRDLAGVCNAGSDDTENACWDALSDLGEDIATSASANHPLGENTVVRFRLGIDANANQPAGEYYATTTITALAL